MQKIPTFPIRVFTENDSRIIENEQDYKTLLTEFEYIRAAGGIVRNTDGAVLMIYRRKKWDFPKGKVEAGETDSTAAVREVHEETGITAKIIIPSPISLFHTYDTYGKKMLKETLWFPMQTIPSHQNPIPQTEEDIERAAWIPTSQINELLKDSYASLKETWNIFLNLYGSNRN